MIRKLRLEAFKCFRSLELRLAPLTVLAGVNGAGKSSALQPLLLLHQALLDQEERPRISTLALNGSIVSLGALRDVVNRAAGGRAFRFQITTDDRQVTWFLDEDREGGRDASVLKTRHKKSQRVVATKGRLFPRALEHSELLCALRQLRYAPADRVGPLSSYPLLTAARHRVLGPRGDRAVGALYFSGPEAPVLEGLRHPRLREQPRLDRQVEAWLGELFAGVVLDVQPVGPLPTPEAVTLALRTSPAGEFDRPVNVGFGMTYVLPVVVALVGARAGEVVVIENPEAHLHPRAQSGIARLCARAAASGVQVLVETHSDHVLNGIRVAVHRRVVPATDVAIHFFGPLSRMGESQPASVELTGGQRYANRPELFFDEIERQLSELLTEDEP